MVVLSFLAVAFGHTDDVPYIGIKEVLGVAGAEEYRRIGSSTGTADGDDIFIRADETGVHGHDGDFHADFKALA